jgi:hypothetical protein
MYYADPDGNQLEFQVDCLRPTEESNAYIRGPSFSINPDGVEFDPDDWLAQLAAGAPLSGLFSCVVYTSRFPRFGRPEYGLNKALCSGRLKRYNQVCFRKFAVTLHRH